MRRTICPLPEDARRRIADSINQRVADTYALYFVLKSAHWNGEGPEFIALHKLFDKFAASAIERADAMAERVIGLAVPANGSPASIAKSSVASNKVEFAPVLDYVNRVLDAYASYDSGLRATRLVAIQMGDRETAQYLDALLFDVEHDAALLAPHVPIQALPPAPPGKTK